MKKTAIAKKLLAGAPAAVLALGLGPAAAQSLVISNWDGYMPADMAEQFEADTGISIDVANHATNEEIMGKVTASGGKGYDVIFVSSPFAEALDKLGIAAKLDHSMLPNMENLYPEARELSYDEGLTFSIPTPGARPASATAPTWCRKSPTAGWTCSTPPTTWRARSRCCRPTAG